MILMITFQKSLRHWIWSFLKGIPSNCCYLSSYCPHSIECCINVNNKSNDMYLDIRKKEGLPYFVFVREIMSILLLSMIFFTCAWMKRNRSNTVITPLSSCKLFSLLTTFPLIAVVSARPNNDNLHEYQRYIDK